MRQPEQKPTTKESRISDLTPLESPGVAPTWSIADVSTVEGCRALAEVCRVAPRISIDTETYDWVADKGAGPSPATVGNLALLQIGLPETREAFLIDIVALEASHADWKSVLGPILESPTPQKVVHFGLFERAVFERCGLTFDAGVLDTCALAKALWKEIQEHHPGITSKSLKSLAHHLLGKDISKTEQTSDWKARPLSQEQRAYAALDVEIAADLCLALERLAEAAGVEPRSVDWKTQRNHRVG